jgi:hypothetical protein
MRLQSGNAFLISATNGSGNIFALATSLNPESGNFSRHALFVPVFLRAVLQGSSELPAPLIIGNDHDFVITDTLVSNDNVFHLINKTLRFDIIPESRLMNTNTVISVHDQIDLAQNYNLISNDKLIAVIAFNYDRKESDLNTFTKDDLVKKAQQSGNTNINVIDSEGKDLTHSIAQINEGKRLWKYCIIFALLFLAIEILLIRYFQRLA